MECSLSRAAVEFMVFDLNLTKVLTLINTKVYGIDEILIPTLMTTDALNIPGGFTHYCLNKNMTVSFVTRLTHWSWLSKCYSKRIRHSICVFGVADLKYLREYPHIFGNKIMSDIDFTASVCWREFLFNKTYINPIANPADELNKSAYLNLPTVRYNKERYDPNFDISNFRCNLE